jgi:hypothetical protein
MEPYSAAGGVVPRMLITCGHEFCEGCLDTILHPLRLKHGRKQLGCPMCRAVCPIRGGGRPDCQLSIACTMLRTFFWLVRHNTAVNVSLCSYTL